MAIPFNQQRLWRDFISTIRIEKCRGQAVPGDDLLRAVEQEIGPLPADLRELFSAFSIPAVKRRGRPANHPAREEFGMKELDQRYSELLRRFQSEAGGSQPRGKASPSERAYQHLATTMSTSFGNIDWRALRNKHSSWKSGRLHSSENVAIDSEDFDAEIERQFPALINDPRIFHE